MAVLGPPKDSGWLELPAARICWQRWGSGPAVVLIHGWCCRGQDFLELIQALHHTHQLVVLDLPHHGASSSNRLSWSMDELATLVVELVSRLQCPTCTLVGHSMGAAVAIEAAIRLGQRCRQVIGLDAITHLNLYPAQRIEVIEASLANFQNDFASAIAELVHAAFPADAQRSLMLQVAAQMASTPVEPALAMLRQLYLWDADTALQQLRQPLDLVVARCFLTPEAIDRYRVCCRIHQIDVGGHFFFREDPIATASRLAAIMDGVAPT